MEKRALLLLHSMEFLRIYRQSIDIALRFSMKEIAKGKMLLLVEAEKPKTANTTTSLACTPPSRTRLLFSVDCTFSELDGTTAAGMILQRHDGTVIFAAYRYMFKCNDALGVPGCSKITCLGEYWVVF